LRDDLEDVVAHAARQGMWVSLVTNGLSLDHSRVRGLREAGLHNLCVSLDAADAAVHDGQRGVEGAYERTLGAVRLLGDAFVGGCRTAGIMTVVTRRNERGLSQIVDLAARAGVRLVVQPHHRRVDDDLAPESIRRAVQDLLDHPRRRGVLLNTRRYLERMSAFDEQKRPRDCHAGRKYFSVDPYGGIHPCVDLPRVGHVLEAGLAALRSPAVIEEVEACRGCWYCFRGEADGMLTLGGYAQKLALASGVYFRNVGRPPVGGERGSDLRAGASAR
jgi:pyrroloquinoline quinone biosynthesis protein E